jgi:DNA-directed RNA polymerase subunit RPC12/RpoP
MEFWALIVPREVSPMKKPEIACPECGAGYRRIELIF